MASGPQPFPTQVSIQDQARLVGVSIVVAEADLLGLDDGAYGLWLRGVQDQIAQGLQVIRERDRPDYLNPKPPGPTSPPAPPVPLPTKSSPEGGG